MGGCGVVRKRGIVTVVVVVVVVDVDVFKMVVLDKLPQDK